MKILVLAVAGNGHSERRRKRCRRVTRTECVVFGFVPAQESGQTAILLYGVQLIATAGQDLMSVRLMPHVPNKTVLGRIKNIMHRHGKLDSTETGSRVAADP